MSVLLEKPVICLLGWTMNMTLSRSSMSCEEKENPRYFKNCYDEKFFAYTLIFNILSSQVLDEKLVFVKVHAPWEVLCTYAEVMHIKLPLQHNDLKTRESAFNWFSRLFRVDENIIKPEQEFFTAPFRKELLSNFYIQDKDTFFNPATRSRIVSPWSISSIYYSFYQISVITFPKTS